jgi:adenylate cyclase
MAATICGTLMVNHTHENPFWHDVLSGRIRKRVWRRRLFRLISPGARERCHLCLAPFDGVAAPLMRAIGRGPWRRNPQYCDKCELLFSECRGGAEVELAVVYADVRGSTQLAAKMRPIEFVALMERFFIAATKILTAGGAAIDKMVGDEVVALYLPGLTGDRHNYRRNATRAGIELLRATGHADARGPWLPVGVSVHSGVAFVGSIGTERGTHEFAALGETMNLGARLVAAAGTGELVISEAIWPEVATEIKAERRALILKGIDRPIVAYVARVEHEN